MAHNSMVRGSSSSASGQTVETDDREDIMSNNERPRHTSMSSRDSSSSFYYLFPSVTGWSTVAGIIPSLKNDQDFNLKGDNKYIGLLQTAFVITYMIFAPIFGYMGDRYSRTWIAGLGVSFWCLATLIGSFMKNFWWFLFFRALVGVGEASYSTIAPAIISDMFSKDTRSQILAIFYFAIPVGTGLGYIVGSEVAEEASDWRWGLRVTPFLGLIAVVAIMFFMVDPPRGESEGSCLRPSSTPKTDLIALSKNKSYIFTTIAFTCVTFSTGALMWWGPDFAYLGAKAECGLKSGCNEIRQSDISYRFGLVMTFAGLIGVPSGSHIAQVIRKQVANGDPIVCGTTLLSSVPILFVGLIMARYSLGWCYALTFLAGLMLNCNWSVVSDMTLYVVVPTRRSLASATQILFSHMLGDAMSPYLVGVISDWIRPAITPSHAPLPDTPEYYDIQFRCLQYAFFAACFSLAIGGFFFLVTSFYILEDKNIADRKILEGEDDEEEVIFRSGGED